VRRCYPSASPLSPYLGRHGLLLAAAPAAPGDGERLPAPPLQAAAGSQHALACARVLSPLAAARGRVTGALFVGAGRSGRRRRCAGRRDGRGGSTGRRRRGRPAARRDCGRDDGWRRVGAPAAASPDARRGCSHVGPPVGARHRHVRPHHLILLLLLLDRVGGCWRRAAGGAGGGWRGGDGPPDGVRR